MLTMLKRYSSGEESRRGRQNVTSSLGVMISDPHLPNSYSASLASLIQMNKRTLQICA